MKVRRVLLLMVASWLLAGSILGAVAVPLAAASFPLVKITPEAIDFGTMSAGSTSQPAVVTVANEPGGTFGLAILDVRIKGPSASEFAIVNDMVSGHYIDNGTSSTLGIVFKPAYNGQRTATLVIVTNAGIDLEAVPFEVPLSGVGAGGSPPPVTAPPQATTSTATPPSVTMTVPPPVTTSPQPTVTQSPASYITPPTSVSTAASAASSGMNWPLTWSIIALGALLLVLSLGILRQRVHR